MSGFGSLHRRHARALFLATLAILTASTTASAQRRRRHRHHGGGDSQGAGTQGDPSGAANGAAASGSNATTSSGAGATSATQGATGASATATGSGSSGAVVVSPRDDEHPGGPAPVGARSLQLDTVRAPPPPPPPTESAAPRPRPVAIDVSIGPRLTVRSFWYNVDLFQELRPYLVTMISGGGSLEFFPGALASSGPASWFGLVASGEYTVPIAATDRFGRTYSTTAWNVTAGLRARWTVGNFELGGTVAYGRQEYSFGDTAMPGQPGGTPTPALEGLANVTYNFLRFGFGGRWQIVPRIAVLASGAYLLSLASGDALWYQRPTVNGDVRTGLFPRAGIGGIEAGAGIAVTLGAGFELRGRFDWRRYFMGMNPQPGDPWIAGGAVDDYVGGHFDIAFRR